LCESESIDAHSTRLFSVADALAFSVEHMDVTAFDMEPDFTASFLGWSICGDCKKLLAMN
jgi:hypothetical protein